MDKKQRHYLIWYILESVIYMIIVIMGASMLLFDSIMSFTLGEAILDPHFILIMFGATILGLIMLKLGLIQKKVDGVI